MKVIRLAIAGVVGVAILALAASAAGAERRPFGPADIASVRDIGDVQISPEGDWVAYVLRTSDLERDKISGDIWMARWDGSQSIQLTHTPDGESQPRWSPDGRYLSFLASRGDGDQDEKTQVWLLDRAGGEAQKLTALEGGVSYHAWSPDSRRLALIGVDPDPNEKAKAAKEDDKPKTPPPIVIDRYQFKQDGEGFLVDRWARLYLFHLETKKAELLSEGDFDHALPSWSPDGSKIAFASKQGPDPDRHDNWDLWVVEAAVGAKARQLTFYEGSDGAARFRSPAAWSPDGSEIAYVRGGPPRFRDYDSPKISVVATVGGEPRFPAPDLDRFVRGLTWSPDGHLYFLLEDDQVEALARVRPAGGAVERIGFSSAPADTGVTGAFAIAKNGRIAAVIGRPHQPAEVFARDGSSWRALSSHNRELLEQVALGAVEGIAFKSTGGAEIHGVLTKPPGFEAGRRYPTVVQIHGGPVGQDGFDFDASAQVLAGAGYLVVQPNYRGSSGRGSAFSRAIYADWGNLEVEDVLAAVDHLVAAGLADPDRLGIGGWSYGGMTTNYTIASDTRFKAAVSGASVSNMITAYGTDQYIRQYESEVGLPWQEIDTYLKISYPFFHADRIKTPTLFLCGEKDFNVPLIHSEQMYQALRSLGVPTQLVIYPGQYHGLSKPSYIRDRWERGLAWLGRYLLDGEAATSATAGARDAGRRSGTERGVSR